jgi:hypothetical protein
MRLHYSIWVQEPDAYPQSDNGRIKAGDVRLRAVVISQLVMTGIRDVRRTGAACATRVSSLISKNSRDVWNSGHER